MCLIHPIQDLSTIADAQCAHIAQKVSVFRTLKDVGRASLLRISRGAPQRISMYAARYDQERRLLQIEHHAISTKISQ